MNFFHWMRGPLRDEVEQEAGGGVGVVEHGVPVEHDDEPLAPAKPAAAASAAEDKPKDDERLRQIETELAEERRKRQEAENDARFWARRAQSKPPADPDPEGEEEAPADNPETLLGDMTRDGVEALRKRGFITQEEFDRRIRAIQTQTQEQIAAARTDAEFGIKIQNEFPEIAEDSERISKGLAPKSELFKRAGEIYRQSVAEDPELEGKKSTLLMAARQAKAELAQVARKGGGEDEVDTTRNGRGDRPARQADRRQRIDRQMPTRSRGDDEEAGPSLDPQQQEVMKHLKVSPEEFQKHAGGGRRGR